MQTIFRQQGKLAYLSAVEVDKSKDLAESVKKAVSNPLYSYSIKGAKGLLFNITGARDLSLTEVNYISKSISGAVNKGAKIIFGISQKEKFSDKIRIVILATGCGGFTQTGGSQDAVKEEKTKVKTKKSGGQKRKKAKILKEKKPKVLVKPAQGKAVSAPQPKEPLAEDSPLVPEGQVEVRVRRSALDIKKETEATEQELLEEESFWEIPAFLRKRN